MKRLSVTFLILLLALPAAAADTAAELFAAARAMIDANCADCYQATRHGLEGGIDTMKQAIDAGFTDQVAAYKALARGYNTLALVHAIPDSDEQKLIVRQQQAVYEHLVEIAPNDAEVRIEYALFLREPAAKVEHLEVAAKAAPDSADARYLLALALLDAGDAEAASPHARRAIALARQSAVGNYLKHLEERLGNAGLAAEAEHLRNEARRKAK